MKQKFFACEHCGTIVSMIRDGGAPLMCCGEKLKELIPGITEGASEKHVPVFQVNGDTVTVCVGSAEHPMTPEHSIQWVALQTTQGAQYKTLHSENRPEACFALCGGDKVESVYAYCNLHGLWMASQQKEGSEKAN